MAILSVIFNHSRAHVPDLLTIIKILLVVYLFTISLSCFYFQWVSYRYWPILTRKFKFMEAVIEDVDDVSEAWRKINEKPHVLRDSLLKSGATLQLDEAERNWVDATRTLIRSGKGYIETYLKLSKRRNFLKWIYYGFTDFFQIRDLYRELGSWHSETCYQYWYAQKEVYKSAQRSRSTVRSLQERPISVEDKFKCYQPAPSTVSIECELNRLVAVNRCLVSDDQRETYLIMFQVHLLVAFLLDLEGYTFESETENAWVEEAEKIFLQLQGVIHIIWRVHAFLCCNWIVHPFFCNWMTRRLLRVYFDYIKKRLRYLIVKRYLFGFTFIRRLPSQLFHRSQQQRTKQATTNNDDKDIFDLLEQFHREVSLEKPRVYSRLQNLADSFKEAHRLLVDANKEAVEGMENSRKVWKDKLKIVVKDAITCLSLVSESRKSNSTHKEVDDHPWHKFSEKIERFHEAIEFLNLSIELFRIELWKETNSVVGLEEDVHEMVSRLTTNGDEQFSIHSIVGMEGIGKTTLALEVFNNKAIKKHYKHRYWVSIPDNIVDHKNLLLRILAKVLCNYDEKGKEKDYSFNEVKDVLKGKKYLLVLDKISSKETWDVLKEAFRDSKKGSRILLTTRDMSVASHAGGPSCDPYQLQLRNKDQSWGLFEQMVHIQPDQISTELAEKVVRRCGGLPLCILSHGYLLSGKDVTTKDLSRVLEHVNPYQTPWLENLETNEKDLPPYLRKCLSYFAKFPTDYEIPRRRLANLWVVEGFVKQSDDQKEESLKSVAENYLSELIRRNLVQVLDGTLNRNFETCVFPATLQKVWLQLHPISSLEQHVLYYYVGSSSHGHAYGQGSKNSPNILENCRNPLSMLCFDTREGEKPGENIGIFIHKHIASGHLLKLKVLDLEHVFRPQLPNNIGKLIQLTYLGLRWTFLETIPSSIGKLVELETLDVKHTYIRTLPSSIWKLQKLQHLYMSDICRSKIKNQTTWESLFDDEPNTNSNNCLENLQLLRGAFVDKDSPLMDALKRMKKLQLLDLAFHLEKPQQLALAENLVELHQLQELTLKSIDEVGRPQDLHVNHFSCLVNLSRLYLYGKLMNPSSIINLTGIPQSLTELTLSGSGLSDDPMPKLEKLHNLQTLCFHSASYTGKSMVCSNGGFPQLHVLKFWLLQELEEWIVKEQAMPSLKQLEIRSCKKLKLTTTITVLTNLKTLLELKLKEMPENFKNSIEQNKQKIWEDISFSPIIVT